jgi:hypothetical protein
MDWYSSNPMGMGINWYPMEASMRAIVLVLLFEVLRQGKLLDEPTARELLALAAVHGEFVWRTREYTEVRGNHYAANVVALMVIGHLLRTRWERAEVWWRWSQREIGPEVHSQILPDGVQFEKSIPYHCLVTELFVLALLVTGRESGWRRLPPWSGRLEEALRYLATCRRPDGMLPNVGDNDDARLLAFEGENGRRADGILAVGEHLLSCQLALLDVQSCPTAAGWLVGGVCEVAPVRRALPSRVSVFTDGGVVVIRDPTLFLWVDTGEVGLRGRGGHGHNDLLSFELWAGSSCVAIDPGCFTYTGNPVLRDAFRETAAHNTVRIDGEEMAPLRGMWEIGPDACPIPMHVTRTGSVVEITAGHDGYGRLPDPVLVTRRWLVDIEERALVVEDVVRCGGTHLVERFVHLPTGAEVRASATRALVFHRGGTWLLHGFAPASLRVDTRQVSEGYGLMDTAPCLVITREVHRTTALRLRVRLLREPL